MIGEPQPSASEVIVYVDHSDIHEGRLEDLKDGTRRVVNVIETSEPQLLAYGFHLDEEALRMTVTAVHPDSASLELHLEIGKEEFRKLADMITLTEIEVYGSISERVRAMLEQKAAMLGGSGVTVTERFAGFARAPQARHQASEMNPLIAAERVLGTLGHVDTNRRDLNPDGPRSDAANERGDEWRSSQSSR